MDPLIVLFVDRNPIFRQSVLRFIQEHMPEQIVVGGAVADGREALALLAHLHPDVVLWGVAMPALPQLQLLPQLRTMLPQAGIIVLGVLDSEDYRQAALAAGADLFLPKDGLTLTLLPALVQLAHDREAE